MSTNENQLSRSVQSSIWQFGKTVRNVSVPEKQRSEGIGKYFERQLRQWLEFDPNVPDPGDPGGRTGADFPNYNVDVKAVKKHGSGLRGTAAIRRPVDPLLGLEYGLLIVAYSEQRKGAGQPRFTAEEIVFVPRKFTADANRSRNRHIDFRAIRDACSEGQQALKDAVSRQLAKVTALFEPKEADLDDDWERVGAGVVKFREPNPRWTLDFTPAFEAAGGKSERLYERSPAGGSRVTGKRRREDDDDGGRNPKRRRGDGRSGDS